MTPLRDNLEEIGTLLGRNYSTQGAAIPCGSFNNKHAVILESQANKEDVCKQSQAGLGQAKQLNPKPDWKTSCCRQYTRNACLQCTAHVFFRSVLQYQPIFMASLSCT